jgi:hypothetical protein
MPWPDINARNGYRSGSEDRSTFLQNTQRGVQEGTVQPLYQGGFQKSFTPQPAPQPPVADNYVNAEGEVVAQTTDNSYQQPQMRETEYTNLQQFMMAQRARNAKAQPLKRPEKEASAFSKLASSLKGADKSSMANTALGVIGGVRAMNAYNDKPYIAPPGRVYSQRPVHNYAAMRMQGMQTNADAQAGSTRQLQAMAGADINAYLSGQQGMLQTRLKADGQVNQTVDGYQRADAQAAATLANEDARYNFETQRSFQEARYNNEMSARREQMQQGQQMLQGAVTYGLQKRADEQGYAERVKQQGNNMRLEGFREELRNLSGYPVDQQEKMRADIYARYGYNPQQFQQGFKTQ